MKKLIIPFFYQVHMVKGFNHKIRETLYKELGDLGERIFEKQCKKIGTTPSELSVDELDDLAERVFDSVRFYTSMEKAEAIKSCIRKYTLIDRLNRLDDVDRSPIRLKKEYELLMDLGSVSEILGDIKEAVGYFEKAKGVAEKIKNDKLVIDAMNELIRAYTQMGNTQDAKKTSESCERFAKKIDYEFGKAECMRQSAIIQWRKGEFHDAAKKLKQALEIFERDDEKPMIAQVYKNLGDVYGEKEDYESSLTYYDKSLSFYESEDGYEYEKTNLLMNKGVIYSLIKDWKKAAEFYEKTQRTAKKNQFFNTHAWALFNLGESYTYLEEFKAAEKALEESLELLKDQHDPVGEAGVEMKFGQLLKKKGEYKEAEKHLKNAVESLRQLDIQRYLADAVAELGEVKYELDKHEESKELLEEAVQIYDTLGLIERMERVDENLVEVTKSLK